MAPFWLNFDFTTLQGLLNSQMLEKWRKIKYFPKKIYKISSSNFLLFFGCDILLWNCFEEFEKSGVKEGDSVSRLLPIILQKFLKF